VRDEKKKKKYSEEKGGLRGKKFLRKRLWGWSVGRKRKRNAGKGFPEVKKPRKANWREREDRDSNQTLNVGTGNAEAGD